MPDMTQCSSGETRSITDATDYCTGASFEHRCAAGASQDLADIPESRINTSSHTERFKYVKAFKT